MVEGNVDRVQDENEEMTRNLSPCEHDFVELPDGYDLAMLTLETRCDLETPVSAFLKLKGSSPCFMLESAEKGRNWGRYSFLGFDAMELAVIEGGRLVVSNGERSMGFDGNPVQALFEHTGAKRVYLPDGGIPFGGGAVGYFGYDTLPHLEKVEVKRSGQRLPELMFMFPRRVVIFDHLRSRFCFGVLVGVPRGGHERREVYRDVVRQVSAMLSRLKEPVRDGLGSPPIDVTAVEFEGVSSNVTRGRFEKMVDRARDHIYEGDAFQIVVSQKFTVPVDADPFSVYRYLRSENPSPYMFYLELPGVHLVGSSPEPMVTNRGGNAVIRPIAGTRPRGEDEAEDEALALELKADPKERAEHVMLVDLARNDLGRVSEPGTVRVTGFMEVEKYSHVMHLVSQVEGRLGEGMDNYELLKSTFPAGTVSGAPKIRACQIIDELEPDGRGPYAGAVGYISYSGDMDTCIAIRTIVMENGLATVQAGAGIVADSVPRREWEESRNKARALIRALRGAGGVSG